MKALHAIAFILVVVGGLNWGLVGVADYNVVSLVGQTLEKVVYILVGLSAIYLVLTHKSTCKNCSSGGSQSM